MDLFLILHQCSWVSLAGSGGRNRHVCVWCRYSGLQPLSFLFKLYDILWLGKNEWEVTVKWYYLTSWVNQSHTCAELFVETGAFTASPPEKGFPLNSVLTREDNVSRYNISVITTQNSCRKTPDLLFTHIFIYSIINMHMEMYSKPCASQVKENMVWICVSSLFLRKEDRKRPGPHPAWK